MVVTTVASEASVIGSGRGVLRPSTRTDDGKQVLKCISMASLITPVRYDSSGLSLDIGLSSTAQLHLGQISIRPQLNRTVNLESSDHAVTAAALGFLRVCLKVRAPHKHTWTHCRVNVNVHARAILLARLRDL